MLRKEYMLTQSLNGKCDTTISYSGWLSLALVKLSQRAFSEQTQLYCCSERLYLSLSLISSPNAKITKLRWLKFMMKNCVKIFRWLSHVLDCSGAALPDEFSKKPYRTEALNSPWGEREFSRSAAEKFGFLFKMKFVLCAITGPISFCDSLMSIFSICFGFFFFKYKYIKKKCFWQKKCWTCVRWTN